MVVRKSLQLQLPKAPERSDPLPPTFQCGDPPKEAVIEKTAQSANNKLECLFQNLILGWKSLEVLANPVLTPKTA